MAVEKSSKSIGCKIMNFETFLLCFFTLIIIQIILLLWAKKIFFSKIKEEIKSQIIKDELTKNYIDTLQKKINNIEYHI